MNARFPVSIAMCCAGLLLAACAKQEEAPTASQSSSPAPSATATPSAEIKAAVDTAASTAAKATEEVKAPPAPTPPAANTAGTSQLQTILAQAKQQFTEKKYNEALATLSQLSNVSLAAEEQKMVDQLKGQIQSALASQTASEGAKSLGNLLDTKK